MAFMVLVDQVLGDLVERLRRDPQMHFLARTQHGVHRHFGFGGQQFLGFARLHHQHGRVFVRQRRQLFFLMDVAEQAVVEVVAAQRRIAARGQHFEHALAQLEDEISKVPPPRS
jgi:hypothetical protein